MNNIPNKITNHERTKIGFLIHAAELCVHYHPIWLLMDTNEFEVVLYGTPYERSKTLQLTNQLGITTIHAEDIIRSGYQYDVLISNLSMYTIGDKPLIHHLGKFNIRQMYALGKAKHNFAKWNCHYDLIMCFGPYQANRMKIICDVATVEVGYPRYDRFFNEQYNRLGMLEELGLDPNKKSILWLPTWLELSSMDDYADAISALSTDYNVIVKTHPLSLEAEPKRIEKLACYPFTLMINDVYDNLDLFLVSDFVFCDYGGTAFGALYLDLNLLLLNIAPPEDDQLTGIDSPDILLRQSIVNIEKDQKHTLDELLNDSDIWQQQKHARAALRLQYFTHEYGTASPRVVETIRQQLNNIQ
jgi:hypothetical protein